MIIIKLRSWKTPRQSEVSSGWIKEFTSNSHIKGKKKFSALELFWVTQVNYIIGKEYIPSFENISLYNHEKLFVAGSCPEFFGGGKN